MIVKKVKYSRKFIKEFSNLPEDIKKITVRKEEIFKINPLHPSLRLHALKGKFLGFWSISINMNYRIIFVRLPDGNIAFVSIGKHDIYKNI